MLWRRARKLRSLPTPDDVAKAKELIGCNLVALNDVDHSIELKRSGMRLDFGAIAKGFIAQEVSQLLKDRGLSQSLVAIAGDIVVGDPPPGAESWRVSVASLKEEPGNRPRMLLLKNCAVSTSGDAYQFVEIAGTRYSHVVDPRTGIGLTRRSSVTVVAADGASADALSTAVGILGPEQGLRLIEANIKASVLIAQANDDGIEVIQSKGFGNLEAKH